MTTTDPATTVVNAGRRLSPRSYWFATAPFIVLFAYSGVWSLMDPDGTREVMERLGFPTYFLYPQAIAKLAGLAVILSRRSRWLSGLAFAGFLYDLLLAWGAHVANGEPDVWLASAGLVAWAAAFWADQRRFPAPPLR